VTPAEPAAQAEARVVRQLRAAKAAPAARRLGRLRQRLQDQHRQDRVRRHAVAAAGEFIGAGHTQRENARWLRITSRTLRRWRHDQGRGRSPAAPAGRPAARSARGRRNEVIHHLDLYGPGVGLRHLCEAFPDMARAELEDLLTRYRRVWRRRRRPLSVLHWTTPGAVWAVDLARPPAPVDGIFDHLLAVRDLASSRQLLWLPLRDATAAAVADALASLLVIHGPPLVVKSDNGSAFGAPAVATLLRNFGVASLFSPPQTPSYNGAIEAAIGALKDRTEAHAARHGRPGRWTWDDVAAARREANATVRPHGPAGPTPDEAWAARPPLTTDLRRSFRRSVEAHRDDAR
jgi:transposase InsO family protein